MLSVVAEAAAPQERHAGAHHDLHPQRQIGVVGVEVREGALEVVVEGLRLPRGGGGEGEQGVGVTVDILAHRAGFVEGGICQRAPDLTQVRG